MNWLSLLHTIAKYGFVLYLVSHGISLPADSNLDPQELAVALCYGSFAWLWSGLSRASAVIERSYQP